jgi:predicted enzyme related to lactoylglutathione lyase
MHLNGIMIGTEDPGRMTAYYTKLFGPPAWDQGGFSGWQFGAAWIVIGAHDKVQGANTHPGRLMWNLESSDVPGDFERLKGAGATVVAEPYHPDPEGEGWIATLSDPDDNYFQLMSPME